MLAIPDSSLKERDFPSTLVGVVAAGGVDGAESHGSDAGQTVIPHISSPEFTLKLLESFGILAEGFHLVSDRLGSVQEILVLICRVIESRGWLGHEDAPSGVESSAADTADALNLGDGGDRTGGVVESPAGPATLTSSSLAEHQCCPHEVYCEDCKATHISTLPCDSETEVCDG